MNSNDFKTLFWLTWFMIIVGISSCQSNSHDHAKNKEDVPISVPDPGIKSDPRKDKESSPLKEPDPVIQKDAVLKLDEEKAKKELLEAWSNNFSGDTIKKAATGSSLVFTLDSFPGVIFKTLPDYLEDPKNPRFDKDRASIKERVIETQRVFRALDKLNFTKLVVPQSTLIEVHGKEGKVKFFAAEELFQIPHDFGTLFRYEDFYIKFGNNPELEKYFKEMFTELMQSAIQFPSIVDIRADNFPLETNKEPPRMVLVDIEPRTFALDRFIDFFHPKKYPMVDPNIFTHPDFMQALYAQLLSAHPDFKKLLNETDLKNAQKIVRSTMEDRVKHRKWLAENSIDLDKIPELADYRKPLSGTETKLMKTIFARIKKDPDSTKPTLENAPYRRVKKITFSSAGPSCKKHLQIAKKLMDEKLLHSFKCLTTFDKGLIPIDVLADKAAIIRW